MEMEIDMCFLLYLCRFTFLHLDEMDLFLNSENNSNTSIGNITCYREMMNICYQIRYDRNEQK